jgi:hypothetical protein
VPPGRDEPVRGVSVRRGDGTPGESDGQRGAVGFVHDESGGNGNLEGVELSENAVLIYEYEDPNDLHNATTITDSGCASCGGSEYGNEYDAGRVRTVTIAGDTTEYSYTTTGKLHTVTLPKSALNELEYFYDGLDRLEYVEDAFGNRMPYVYDSAVSRLREDDKDVNQVVRKTTSHGYDELHGRERIPYTDGTFWQYGYDARGLDLFARHSDTLPAHEPIRCWRPLGKKYSPLSDASGRASPSSVGHGPV